MSTFPAVEALHCKYLVITVENFYWVLYEALLKPCNLDCKYFWPFGTIENLSTFEYGGEVRKHNPHVLFHFDQEPIYPHAHDTIAFSTQGNYLKVPRLLANSEHSAIKKTMCQEYHLLDWYFFYHGFAAINWFQDTQHIDHDPEPKHAFLSFNRLVTGKRSYRMALTARLAERQILDGNLISFHGDANECALELADPRTELTYKDRYLVQIHLMDGMLPRSVDNPRITGNFSARMGHNEYRWRKRALWHVVNETVFYDDKLHLTEKIFQPIVTSRPFVLVAAPGNLAYLRSYGFKTFSDWIDESYDLIQDSDQRLDAIAGVLEDLSNRSHKELVAMWQDMRPTLEFNRRHLWGAFRQLIVDELVDNFETCLRLWNNGRVDDRCLPSHPDLAAVKQLLLR